MFLLAALASGGALLTFIVAFFWPEKGSREHHDLTVTLGSLTLALLALDLLTEWAEFSIHTYVAIPATAEAYKLVLFGPYWWVFWIVHLGLGALLPAAMLILRGRQVAWVGTAAFLIASAFISARLNIVIPALAIPELRGLERAYIDPRLSFNYFPSLMEWMVGIFAIALGVALFYVGSRVLPIFETKEV